MSSELTVSRTVTLRISDWARIEEIKNHREIKSVPDVLKYIIRAEYSLIQAKKERDNSYLEQIAG